MSKKRVFVSYGKPDRDKVSVIVEHLTELGFDVWWDGCLNPGDVWRAVIRSELELADFVVVVWSQNSTNRNYVHDEANHALREVKFYPVLLGLERPPLGFQSIQSARVDDVHDAAQLEAAFRHLARLRDATAPATPAHGGVEALLDAQPGPRSPSTDRSALDLLARVATLRHSSEVQVRVEKLLARIEAGDDIGEPADVAATLEALRDAREHRAVRALGNAYLDTQPPEGAIKVRRLHSQSLIELDRLDEALDRLHAAVGKVSPRQHEYQELKGLIGRVYKQQYVNLREHNLSAAVEALQKSIRSYLTANHMKPPHTNEWLGVNLLALQAAAIRDGSLKRRFFDAKAEAQQLVALLSAKQAPGPWTYASLGEAYIALSEWAHATHAYARFATHRDITPFHINAALRQLREIWRLSTDLSQPSGQVVALLQATMLAKYGTHIEVQPADVAGTSRSGSDLAEQELDAASAQDIFPETIVGDHKARPMQWLKTAFRRAESVGRIEVAYRGSGTGFLVRGADLHPQFGPGPVFITNSHVVSRGAAAEGLPDRQAAMLRPCRPEQARVVFESGPLSSSEQGYRAALLWEAPVADLDCAILRLADLPDDAPTVPIAAAHPPLKVRGFKGTQRNSRVFVIGYPMGGRLHMNLEDSDLLDIGRKRDAHPKHPVDYLHYKSPTQGGNSGSPVFEELDWNVIALHHMGANNRTGEIGKLDGSGTHGANEGVSILSVKEGLADGRGVWYEAP